MRGPINLEKKLDIVFSKWVRFSNAPKGYCKCVTCGKIDAPEQMDAGHFCGRQHKCTRWDERNVWPQCRRCNRFQEGNKEAYAEFLVNKSFVATLGGSCGKRLPSATWSAPIVTASARTYGEVLNRCKPTCSKRRKTL